MSKKRPDELTPVRVLEEIEQGRIRVYRNVLNEPWVYCDHPRHPAGHWRLFAKDFRYWFTCFLWKEYQIELRDRRIDWLLELLAGHSLQNHVANATDPALLDLIEQEPVIAVLIEFMDGRPRYESSMENLWKILSNLAKERGLTRRGSRRFPGGPQVLSRKLHQFHDALKHLGIEVQFRRSNGSKVTLVGRLDASETESSAHASASNSATINELSVEDDRERRIAAINARLQHSSPNIEAQENQK